MWDLVIALGRQAFSGWIERGQDKRALEKARVEAQIAREQKIATAEIDWDLEWARQAQGSWKDEFYTIILTAPLIASVFWPERVQTAFEALDASVPDWWIAAWSVTVAAAFGYRKLINIISGARRPRS